MNAAAQITNTIADTIYIPVANIRLATGKFLNQKGTSTIYANSGITKDRNAKPAMSDSINFYQLLYSYNDTVEIRNNPTITLHFLSIFCDINVP